MKKIIIIILLVATLVAFESCGPLKETLKQEGIQNDPIQIAILNFLRTHKFYKKDSIFSVSLRDTLYRMVLDKSDDENHKWVNGQINEWIIAVSISASNYQFLLTVDSKVGSKGKMPSRFIEENGKLFYWWDDNYPLTEETLAVFKKYNLLQDDESGLITVPDNPTNDAQKAAHYYFCKEDLSKYKRVITNKGIGYYTPPSLNCNNNHHQ